MLVAEVVSRMNFNKDNIQFLNDCLSKLCDNDVIDVSVISNLTSKLFNLLDEHQKLITTLSRKNNSTEVEIGDVVTSVSDAVLLRSVLDKKISIISDVINSNNTSLDVVGLLKIKTGLEEQYVLVNNVIKASDWSDFIK